LRSDEQLVALFRAGNEDAFGVIHDRYRQRLFAYTRQMLSGSRQDAEDAMQDVFLRAYRALRTSQRPITLRPWLYRVAHNRCIDQLRRPVPATMDLFEVSRTPLRDPLVVAERREDLRRLVADVRRLPQQQRSALLMRELQGLTYSELAEALGCTVPAVKSLLVRARMGLADAAESREAACAEICRDLVVAFDRGVRMSGHVRRHVRDCDYCRQFRHQMRGSRRSFAALVGAGAGPFGVLAGLGGSGAAAGGGAVTTTGGAAALGGGAVATTATKLAIVCCAALVTAGGALDLPKALHGAPATATTHRNGHARAVHYGSRPYTGAEGSAVAPAVDELSHPVAAPARAWAPRRRAHFARGRRHFPLIDPDAALFAHRLSGSSGAGADGGTSGPAQTGTADGSTGSQPKPATGDGSVVVAVGQGTTVPVPGGGSAGSSGSSSATGTGPGPGPAQGNNPPASSPPGPTATSSSASGGGGAGSGTAGSGGSS
jgi:RNA polymerase sigma factor (sigma-70 family)